MNEVVVHPDPHGNISDISSLCPATLSVFNRNYIASPPAHVPVENSPGVSRRGASTPAPSWRPPLPTRSPSLRAGCRCAAIWDN